MRILTSLTLAALVLTLPWTVLAAPFMQSSVDIKTLALTQSDLPRGFAAVPDRTVTEERPDGVAVYDITFARERTPENLAAGPFEVRSGVARTAQPDEARAQLASTKDAFVAEGWAEANVPALGDEKVGLTQTTDGEGGKLAHYAYLFRKGSLILMIGIRGRPEATKMEQAVEFAIKVSQRVDAAAGTAAPAGPPPPGGQAAKPSAATGAAGRVRVVNVDGGSANVRAEPSTTADVVAQVPEGTVIDLAGPDREAEGRTWRNVRADGQTGWIAATLTENVSAPAPPPGPSPAAKPAAGAPPPPPPPGGPPTDSAGATSESPPSDAPPSDAPPPPEGGPPPPPPPPSASPQAAASGGAPPPPPPPSNGSSGMVRGTGNGIIVEASVRDAQLSSGKQLVKVHVMREGGGNIEGAIVDMTARLDANRFRSIRLDRTSVDGWTEIEWDMEGPPGTYQVIVEARTDENGPATTVTTSFRWQ